MLKERQRPLSWSDFKEHHRTSVWYSFLIIEWFFEWVAYWLQGLAILEVLELLGRLTIVVAVIFWFIEADDRKRERHYRAWNVINSTKGSTGDGGRREALQDLHRDGVDLSTAPLAQAYLGELQLPNARLVKADLKNTILVRANLTQAILRGANLHEAVLVRANLREADLRNAEMTRANLHDANLVRVNMNGYANLQQADLSGADLREADLRGVHCYGANFSGANLREANLVGVSMHGYANLQQADLSGADLRTANLQQANLSGANLSGANLSGANLSEAINVTQMQIDNACYRKSADPPKLPAGLKPPPQCRGD